MQIRMERLQIIGLKQDLRQAVAKLHRLGVVQVDDIRAAEDIAARPLAVDRDTVSLREDIRHLLSEVNGMINLLPISAPPSETPPRDLRSPEQLLDQIRGKIDKLESNVRELVREREALEAEQETLPHYRATLLELVPLIPPSAHLPENISIGVLTSSEHLHVMDLLQHQVAERTDGQAEMVTKEVDDDLIALFVVPNRHAPAVQELLGHEDISRLQMPDDLKGSPPDSAVTIIEHRMDQIEQHLEALDDRYEDLAHEWGQRLVAWRDQLQDELEVLEVLSKFGETDRTFVIAGWIPTRELDPLRADFEESFGDRVHLATLPIIPKLEDQVPIVLQNPRPVQPFESLVELLHLPSYQGIDPTGLMALILPLFFGLILGDAGYGVVVVALCLLLMRRFREGVLHDLLFVLTLGGGWSILFGILFGEAFGTLGEELGMPALWFHRGSGETIPLLLAITIGVGAAHITLGLLIGAWEAIRERSRSHLMERGGTLLGLISSFLLVGILVDFLPHEFMTPSVAGLIVGIVLLSASYGWTGVLLGPLEFISVLGNILSYLRIAAIGLASVFLAQVANEFGGLLGSLIVGIVVAGLIHAINIVLGMFSPTIQSLRLHYVEFFQKFYEERGQRFRPFRSSFVTANERSS